MSSHDDNDWSDLDTTIPKCGSYRAGCATLAGFQERSAPRRSALAAFQARSAAALGRARAERVSLWNAWIVAITPNVIDLAAYRKRREAAALEGLFADIDIDLGDL